MTRTAYIIIGIIVLLALGGWIFSKQTASSSPAQTATTTEATASTTDAQNGTQGGTKTSGTATFRSIFADAGNHECIYQGATSGSSQSKNVIQIADGKMRGEFRTTTADGTNATIMIYSGGYLYSWKEGATTGKKTSIKTVADLPDAIPADLTSGAILGSSAENVGWDCHNWLKDMSRLTVPTYVKFQ